MERCSARKPRPGHWIPLGFALFLLPISVLTRTLPAQGTTTAAIRGTIRLEGSPGTSEVRIRIVSVPTGYEIETRARNGIYSVQNLVPGGPYRVSATSLGYTPQSFAGITLSLGEQREVNFTLSRIADHLDTVMVRADRFSETLRSGGGVGTFVSDSALHRLPTLNRDLYDFVRLVPQAGTRFGLTGGGANFRYNSYLIDGISDRQLQGNNVMGGGLLGGKTISIEAVKEVQVLLSPYDARYGDFTGMLVNAVTKSGTNDLHGSVYGYARDESLARQNSFVGGSPYRRGQFGLALGGPIIRNRAHFFIAPEFQSSSAPSSGPYVGQDPSVVPPLTVSPADVARFASLLRDRGLNAGDGSRVMILNPAMTLFGRVDVALPEIRSRVVLVENYSNVDVTRFSRTELLFPLSSNAFTFRTSKKSSAIQAFTQLSSIAFNEISLSYMDRPILGLNYTASPSVSVNEPVQWGGKTVRLSAGPPAPAGGIGSTSNLTEIADHVLFQAGLHHTIGVGLKTELFRYHALGVRGQFGVWSFNTLDDVAAGKAASYLLSKDFGGAESPVSGMQPSVYVTDDWRIGDRFSLTVGMRADDMRFGSTPSYNHAVDSIYHRRTSDYPVSHVEWSPRVGFSWKPQSSGATSIRGGAGLFVGAPPLGWLLGPVRSTGSSVQTLSCLGATTPVFTVDPARQPQSCSNGKGFSRGPVDLVDRNLRMAKSFRTSLAVDRRLPWKIDASIEALYSRVRSDFRFVNANLKPPQGTDAHGRVLYATSDAFGVLMPATIGGLGLEVIDLRNHSNGHSMSVTASAEREFTENVEVHAAYTWSRTRDVQSLISSSAVSPFDIWAGGRPLSTSHDDLTTGISSFDIPQRIVLAASYAAPWKRWKTDLSFYYIGESGTPFTFNDSSASNYGDLNYDGTNANDPIYVPLDATHSSEIVFENPTQGEQFEKFIHDTPCIDRQRGSIVKRNSCRGPWIHTSNASIRQSIQPIGGHDLSVQVEVFNVLNLLNRSWGLFKVPNDKILEQKGWTTTKPLQPIFSFSAETAKPSAQNLESGYQLQLSMRISF